MRYFKMPLFVVVAASVLSTSAAFGGGCGDPKSGDCYKDNGTPYCSDAVCGEFICSFMPFCCEVAWEGACVTFAEYIWRRIMWQSEHGQLLRGPSDGLLRQFRMLPCCLHCGS